MAESTGGGSGKRKASGERRPGERGGQRASGGEENKSFKAAKGERGEGEGRRTSSGIAGLLHQSVLRHRHNLRTNCRQGEPLRER